MVSSHLFLLSRLRKWLKFYPETREEEALGQTSGNDQSWFLCWGMQQRGSVSFTHLVQNWILTLDLNFCKIVWSSTKAVLSGGEKDGKIPLPDGNFPIKQPCFGKWTERSCILSCYLLTYMYTKSVAASLGIGQKTRCKELVWLCREMEQW